jgi:hypothetical protein
VKRRLAVLAASILPLCVASYDPASAACLGYATPSSVDDFFVQSVVGAPSEARDLSFAGIMLNPISSGGLLGFQNRNDTGPVQDLLGPIITHDPGPVGGSLGPIITHDPGPIENFLGPIITHDPGPIESFLGPIIMYDPGSIGDSLGTQFQYDLGTSPTRDLFLDPTPIPAALPLVASALGILGLLGFGRKRYSSRP